MDYNGRMGKLGVVHRHSEGMTLVEVLITMGIASTLGLGLMEVIHNSNRANRNVTISADWNNVQALVRIALSDGGTCSRLFVQPDTGISNYTFNPTTLEFLNGANPVTELAFVPRSNGVGGGVLLSSTPGAYTTFSLNSPGGIQIAPMGGVTVTDPANDFSEIQLPDRFDSDKQKVYRVYSLQMSLNATKKANAGDAALGNSTLGTTIPMPFRIVAGPVFDDVAKTNPQLSAPYKVVTCYADSSLAAACASLGGIYKDPPLPGETACVIPRIQFFGNTTNAARGEAGVTPMVGEKIQLFGNAGTPARDDFAIGYRTNQMWFNIGGDGHNFVDQPSQLASFNNFEWHAFSSSPTGESQSNPETSLMTLDAGGTLVVNPADDFDNTRIAFGGPNTGSGALSEYILSRRDQPSGGPLTSGLVALRPHGLEFYTDRKHHLSIRKDGRVRVGSGVLQFGGLNVISGDNTSATQIVADRNPSSATYGSLSFQTEISHGSFPAPVEALRIENDGAVNIMTDGGNVIHGCLGAEVSPAAMTSPGVNVATCSSGRKIFFASCHSQNGAPMARTGYPYSSASFSTFRCESTDVTDSVTVRFICCHGLN